MWPIVALADGPNQNHAIMHVCVACQPTTKHSTVTVTATAHTDSQINPDKLDLPRNALEARSLIEQQAKLLTEAVDKVTVAEYHVHHCSVSLVLTFTSSSVLLYFVCHKLCVHV